MQHTQTFPIKGMHCASCSANIERALKKVPGVSAIAANYGTETAKVSFDTDKTNPEALSKTIAPMGYSLVMPEPQSAMNRDMDHSQHTGLNQSKAEKVAELSAMRRLVWTLIPLATISAIVMVWDGLIVAGVLPDMSMVAEEFIHHLLPIFATYALFIGGKPYLRGLYTFVRHGSANMDTLVGLGTGVAFLYSFIITAFEDTLAPYIDVEHTYYDVTIVVIAFITIGKYLESRAKLKTGEAIQQLLQLQSKTALVVRDGK